MKGRPCIAGLLVGLLVVAAVCIGGAVAARAQAGCPEGTADFQRLYGEREMFDTAIAAAESLEPSNQRLTGIVVPHHLLAADLIALGFRAASAQAYKRIIILAPDHFRASRTRFATSARGFGTVYGRVEADAEAVDGLLGRMGGLMEVSCLFAREHGVQALLPFLRHSFPEARIVPVAMSIRSTHADWDRLAEALAPLVDADTLVVESTDFSHFLPQHEARRHDQQTLNVLAAGSPDAIAALRQPQHADSVGALYVQAKLQRDRFGAGPLVIANANSQDYETDPVAETTSYMVVLFGTFDAGFNSPARPGDEVAYLAGDTFFGRAMKMALLDDGAAERVEKAVLERTRGRPLVLNLEGVVLPDLPTAIDEMILVMPDDLTLDWLRRLNVAGVGLANNHALDLGPSGYAETRRALEAAGIRSFGQGEALPVGGIDIVGLSDLDTNASPQVDLLTPALLDRLVRADGSRPVAAFVHWGREYVITPSARERHLAEEMRRRGTALIVGAHPHAASTELTALAGGETLMAYSLGNFLFDQNASRASGMMLEVRAFPQGTLFARPIPLPNLFDLAAGR